MSNRLVERFDDIIKGIIVASLFILCVIVFISLFFIHNELLVIISCLSTVGLLLIILFIKYIVIRMIIDNINRDEQYNNLHDIESNSNSSETYSETNSNNEQLDNLEESAINDVELKTITMDNRVHIAIPVTSNV